MKVLYFKRFVPSGFHVHAFSSSLCCYVPEKQVVLYRENTSSFGAEIISVTDEPRMLREAKIVNKELNESLDANIEISDIRHAELDDKLVTQAIEIMRTEKDLRERISKMSETLIPKE